MIVPQLRSSAEKALSPSQRLTVSVCCSCLRADFKVTPFDGTKAIVVSTTSWMGGKNPFLGYAYITVGALCLLLAILFAIKQKINPRCVCGPRLRVRALPGLRGYVVERGVAVLALWFR